MNSYKLSVVSYKLATPCTLTALIAHGRPE